MKRNYEIAVLSLGAFARTVRIYAPKSATRAVIMHDGQNAFDDQTATYKKAWRSTDILKELKIKNIAIIGIDSTTTREDDYLPFPNEIGEYGEQPYGGKANIYADYIEKIVIPYLDKRFGFEFYAMLGSSSGALANIAIAARKNARIKAYGFFSTPLFVSYKAYGEFFATKPFPAEPHYLVYTGGSEALDEIPDKEITARIPQLFVDDAFTLTNALRSSGATNITTVMNNKGVHDEICWREPERTFFQTVSKL
ncbi:MAG: hypothetical protein HDT28_02620 [Clostridiales bacterium]|nr:hypothetical protein [Clostridiales bacterium]